MLGFYLSDKNATFQEGDACDKLARLPRGEQGGGHGVSPSLGAAGRRCQRRALSTGKGLPQALGLALQPGHRLLQVLHDEVHLSPGSCNYNEALPSLLTGLLWLLLISLQLSMNKKDYGNSGVGGFSSMSA